jgi:glycosyltransferase involved in cell wall biosynthesis
MNKEDPLVSIIIPTYNRANLLPTAILSVINQNYQNWELIIVDDGSTNNTKQTVEEFIKKDSRIKYFYQENKGQPFAMNTGIKLSKGEFIAFLDDDDEWYLEKLEKQIEFLNKNRDNALVFSDAIIKGGYLDRMRSSEVSKPYCGYVYPKLLLRNFLTASSVVIKRKVLDEIGYFNTFHCIRITQTQDYDMWLRIAKKYKIGYVPEVLVKYNFSPKINSWEKRKNAYKAMIYIYFKNLKIANLFEKFIVIWKLGEYILKLIVANILIAIKR